MIRTAPQADLRTAGHVARRVNLRDIGLASVNAERVAHPSEALTDQLHFDMADNALAELSSDGRFLWVNVGFEATVRREAEAGDLLRLACSIQLAYEVIVAESDEMSLTKEACDTFARVNGTYNAWPYLREFVSNTLVRMGYPPYTLESLIVAPEQRPVDAAEKTPDESA